MKIDSIVYFSSIPWEFSFHRQQDMMAYFAGCGFPVLFVEPPVSLPRGGELRRVRGNINVLSYGGLRFERCLHSAEWLNRGLSRAAVLRAMGQLAMVNPLVWFDRIHGVDCAWFLRRYKTVYDLVDEITAFGRWNNKRMLRRKERFVMGRVDYHVSSSRTLAARKQAYCLGNEIYFCPNGVDSARFAHGEDARAQSEREYVRHLLLRGIDRPIAGFIGTVSRRSIRADLLIDAAARNPDVQFVLIGPSDDAAFTGELVRYSNIHWYDRVDSDEIPALLADFDVGMIPYVTAGEDMDYVFPRKVFEYLASGIPVVSTPVPELAMLGGILHIADDAEGFSRALHAALEQSLEPGTAQCLRAVAQEYDRDALLGRLGQYLRLA